MRYPPVESSSAARAILSPTGGRANSHWVAFAAGLLAYTETSGSAPCHAEVTRAVADADGYCRQRTNSAASTTTEGASALRAPEGIRTPNLLIRSQKRAVSRYVAMFGQPNLTWANRIVMSPRDAGCITRIDVTTP